MKFIHQYICGILALFLTFYFFCTKDLSNKYDKVIMAEGHGYYVYLPAMFIYHDHTFNFFNEVEKKYYAPSYHPPTRNFINEFDGIRVNKYFPGVSLLWLPFFLLAHILALLFHLPADGYSDIYQYAIGIAGIFYTWLGLRFTRKILAHYNIVPVIQVITLAVILFGTNMLLYASTWSSQTHGYSFFLIAAFFWFVIRLFHPQYENKNAALGWCFVLLSLVVSLRPQNAGILVLLPFFGLNGKNFPAVIRNNLFSKAGITGIVIALLVIGRVCWYWYIQTGRIFLNPYHGESYFLTRPHVTGVLFSFRKGWILYSPFIAIGLAGIFFFKRKTDKINLFIFWAVFIYVSSCWWCWTYSSTSFGQRIYVDFYSLIALQAAMLFNYFYQRKIKWPAPAAACVVIPLCLLQTYQYKHGIIPGEYGTAETYFGNFFITHPLAFYPIPESSITDRIEAELPGTDTIFPQKPNSPKKYFRLPSFMVPGDYSIVRTTADVKSSGAGGSKILNMDFVKNGKAVSNNPAYMAYYLEKNKWRTYQSGQPIPEGVLPGDSVSIWFQLAEGNDSAYIKNMKVEFVHTDKSYEFTR